MRNCSELRKELSAVFYDLRARKIKPEEAFELSNIAGKMIASAKVQVEYYAIRKEAPIIEFLAEPENVPPTIEGGLGPSGAPQFNRISAA